MIYVTKIFEPSNWIDEPSNKLSMRTCTQNINIITKYVPYAISDFSRLISKKDQEKAVLMKFKEKTQLIERQEADHT